MDGNVHTFKARLVAKSYTQTQGIDYDETFSPVAKIKSIRILLAIAAFPDYEIWQMDVKTAFLNGKLDEDVYMAQPEGFVHAKYPDKVSEIHRVLLYDSVMLWCAPTLNRNWQLYRSDEFNTYRKSGNIILIHEIDYYPCLSIVDGPLIVNETISWAKRTKTRLFLLKVDFEKAFDNLNWGFLFNVLDQIMGFGSKWIGWVKGLITTASVSVLINGSPTSQFPLEKGVRQGDPLSPFLFIVAMEGLFVTLKEARAKGLVKGVTLPNGEPEIVSLHYADDAIFLGRWNGHNLRNLMKTLKCFHLALGLKINWGKSTLTGYRGVLL
ncbi:hypothetical protein OSB04_017657 [Centaurea solstitialis]|uniref:Reverse transcriptase domain-containing protein n=1 Tax=Centaurea solstitialis TaxID=347529 RepID=A0AA38W9P2_9ASTR|nr:hypothetical protein OSB04_017657 [Centaurea solstitialis]